MLAAALVAPCARSPSLRAARSLVRILGRTLHVSSCARPTQPSTCQHQNAYQITPQHAPDLTPATHPHTPRPARLHNNACQITPQHASQLALLPRAAGLNNNAYQISRGEHYNKLVGHGIDKRCNFVKGDFMKMPFQEGAFDAIYEIDATCHAPDAVGCYKVRRTARPGELPVHSWLLACVRSLAMAHVPSSGTSCGPASAQQ